MARNFLTPINLNKLELQDAVIQNKIATTINGMTPVAGQVYYDSTNNVLRVATGTATTSWLTVATNQTTGAYTSAITIGATSINIGATASSLSNVSISGSGTWTATAIASNYGGTGVTSYAVGDILYASSATAGTALSKLTIGAANAVMVVNGAGTAPSWVTSLSLGQGGTGSATGSITAAAATNLTFTAGSGNQNVVLAPTGTGTVDVSSKKITNLATPTADGDAATKKYVDDMAAGVNAHDAVRLATTGALGTTNNLSNSAATTVYANVPNADGVSFNSTITIGITGGTWGNLSIDGVVIATGNRILIKDQALGYTNGVYTVTSITATSGGSSGQVVFTRATDSDRTPELGQGDLVYILSGTDNGTTSWVQINVIATIGTDAIAWAQFSGASTTSAGNGLTKSGNSFNVGAGTGISVTTDAVAVNYGALFIGSSNVANATSSAASLAGIASISDLTTLTGAATSSFAIAAGSSSGVGTTLSLTGGTGNTSNVGGIVQIVGGTGGATAGNGGAVTITGGAFGAGGTVGGNVTIDAGASTAGSPTISIGQNNATDINIGRVSGGQTTAIISQSVKMGNLSAVSTNAVSSGSGVLRVNATGFLVTDSAVTRKWFYGNPSLTVTIANGYGSISWVITYDANLANLSNIKHNFGATGAISAQVMDYTTGAIVEADVTIAPGTGQVTVAAINPAWTTTPLAANTLALLLIG